MPTLTQLTQKYLAFERSDVSAFQRRARVLQSVWREERGYEAGVFAGKVRGNYLPMPWAKETLSNYLSDTIKEVVRREVIDNRDTGKLYGSPRIFNNLLSSQPLCFNLFAELQQDLGLATRVLRRLCPERVAAVTAIAFEHSPGRGDVAFTGDRSAFDVYVEFRSPTDAKGFVGIEVKYHENLMNKAAGVKEAGLKVASRMNCFKPECMCALARSPLEQIWRDHLLAGSLLHAGVGFEDGFFVFLSPRDNPHCQQAVEVYTECLTDARTFVSWTLEEVAAAIKENTAAPWIDALIDRYLNFGKIARPADESVGGNGV